jgi:hypothetical protein
MRRLLILVLMFSATCPQVFARNKHDWESAKRLKPGTSVYVRLRNQLYVSGRVVSVDDRMLRVSTIYPWDNGQPEEILRANVQKIVQIRRRILPDPHKVIVGGALIGGAVGVTAGAIDDATHGNNGRWFVGGLGGAGLGFFAACMTEAGFGVVALFRPNRVAYEYRDSSAANP